MKKITFNPEETLNINEINNDSFCGVRWKGGDKCIIINTEDRKYIGFNSVNTRSLWACESIQEYLINAKKQDGTECN